MTPASARRDVRKALVQVHKDFGARLAGTNNGDAKRARSSRQARKNSTDRRDVDGTVDDLRIGEKRRESSRNTGATSWRDDEILCIEAMVSGASLCVELRH